MKIAGKVLIWAGSILAGTVACGGETSPEQVCSRISRLLAERGQVTRDEDLQQCSSHLEAARQRDPERFAKMARCLDKAGNESAVMACMEAGAQARP